MNGTVSKTVVVPWATVGSNPTLSAKKAIVIYSQWLFGLLGSLAVFEKANSVRIFRISRIFQEQKQKFADQIASRLAAH